MSDTKPSIILNPGEEVKYERKPSGHILLDGIEVKPSLEYIAGFFDGEGGLNISYCTKKRTKKGSTGKEIYHAKWRYIIYITNTNIEVLQKIKEVLDGSISKISKNKGTKNSKQAYRLCFYGNKAKEFLNKVYPYLIIKKERATLMLEFIYTLQKSGNRSGNYKVPYDIQNKRYNIYLKLFNLNKKGIISNSAPKNFLLNPPVSKFVECEICKTSIRKTVKNKLCKKCYLNVLCGRAKKAA